MLLGTPFRFEFISQLATMTYKTYRIDTITLRERMWLKGSTGLSVAHPSCTSHQVAIDDQTVSDNL